MSYYAPVPYRNHINIRNTGGISQAIFYSDQEGKIPVITINRTFFGNIGHHAKSVKIGPNVKIIVYSSVSTKTIVNDRITDLFIDLATIGLSGFTKVMILIPPNKCVYSL